MRDSFRCSTSLPHLIVPFFLILAFVGIYSYIIVDLICIFLSDGVEYIFSMFNGHLNYLFCEVLVLSFARLKEYIWACKFFSYSYDSFIEIIYILDNSST